MRALTLFFLLLLAFGGCGPRSDRSDDNDRSESALQRCLHKDCFDKIREVKGLKFRLSGISIRKYLRHINVYTAVLYVPEREAGIQVLSADAKILVLKYHRKVEKQTIVDNIRENIGSLPYVNMRKILPRLHQLEAAFEAPIKGDICEFLFIPGEGMTMSQNGKPLITISGDDFAEAFLGIWISPDNGDEKMRSELLGTMSEIPAATKLTLRSKMTKLKKGVRETVLNKPVKAAQYVWRRFTSLLEPLARIAHQQ
jgi:hypothetical protein